VSVNAFERYLACKDPEAFRELVVTYQNMVYGTCSRVLGHGAEADDACQETFIKFARKAAEIRSNPGAWLHACARTTALNLIRRRRHEVALTAGDSQHAEENAAQAHDAAEQSSIVDACLEQLPQIDREIIISYFFIQKSQAEIAKNVGMTQGGLKKRLDRVLELLRSKLLVRGLTVSGVMAAFLADMAAQSPAPAGVAARIIAAVDASSLAVPTSGTSAASTSPTSALLSIGVTIPAIGLTLLAAFAWHSWQRPTFSPLQLAWDFEAEARAGATFPSPSRGDPPPIQLVVGSFSQVEGPHGKCIEVGDFARNITIPAEQLPLHISYRSAAIFSPDAGLNYYLVWEWEEYATLAVFHNVGKTISGVADADNPLWMNVDVYISRDRIDRWIDGHRQSLSLCTPVPGNALRLNVKGRHRIDDLVIRHIEPELVPRVGEFTAAVENIPPENRTGTVPLPELTNIDGAHAITIRFLEPTVGFQVKTQE
jgi:RNA polymerase sigma factor (sigma-70 family)